MKWSMTFYCLAIFFFGVAGSALINCDWKVATWCGAFCLQNYLIGRMLRGEKR